MSNVSEMLQNIPLPRMVPVRQCFDAQCIEDVAAEVRKELHRPAIIEKIKPGMKIAITAGSRGVDNIALVIKEIVSFIKEHDAQPFVIPAMGSHGGATAEGQAAIVREYGITEEYVGCPIYSSMDVTEIGKLDNGKVIYIDKYAAEADGIIPVNRIKAHTAFRGKYESGVMKMMTIGLGKQRGAEVCHRDGIMHLGPNVEKFAFGILEHANILFGVGLVENAYDKTCLIKAMTAAEIPLTEPKLLDIAKQRMARLLFNNVDVLIVDYIGKNISGEGMDPNIAGRFIVPNISGGIEAQRIGILDITEETLGNVVGLGMADVCSKRVVEKMSADNTYPKSLTSTVTCLCKIPMYFDNHKQTIQAAIKMTPAKSPEEITMIRISDTLAMDTIWVSENLAQLVPGIPGAEIAGDAQEWNFDVQNNLF